ncbi:unnamed protein product [Fusarium graminearum]|nr:unnamed protein product [Fusarium graminearum]
MAETPGPSPPVPVVNLEGELRSGKIENCFEKHFLSADKIKLLCTSESIINLLRNENMTMSKAKQLEEYIRMRPARQSFLLLVLIQKVQWMERLADPEYKFGDLDLPNSSVVGDYLVVRRDENYIQLSFSDIEKGHRHVVPFMWLFTHERWPFLAPVFTTANFYHELDDAVPLPLLKSDGSNIPVALKMINDLPKDNWFVREMEILGRIQSIVRENPDLHLITPIASYKLKNDRRGCLLFPWAEGGNLKDFWDRKDNKAGALNQNSRDRGLAKMAWALKQMGGLCKALVELHKPHSPNGTSRSNEEIPHLRHGDLKPENILVFREGNEDILRIADLGLGRFHLKSTDGRKEAKEYTKTITGTTRYMPPEFYENNFISRKLDVWSLGCLFIEFIIWAAWGLEALDKFNKIPNDEFWQKRINPDDVVHDDISSWINSMKNVLFPNTALGDILELVSVGMLKQLERRHTSQKIYNKLKTIVERSQEKDDYCLDWNQKAKILGHTLPAVESGSQNRGQYLISATASGSFNDEYSQIGGPTLPEPGSSEQFLLFKEWIRLCDDTHGHGTNCLSTPKLNNGNLPTRVVDVGSVSNPLIRLVISEDMTSTVYLALSHRWGDDAAKHTGRTLKQNHIFRYKNIPLDELPLNFTDAITVTRGVGIKYLWIDSLCIVQDDDGDWKRESVRMEQVYSNAKCVLAASSAKSSTEGFLNRRTPVPSFVALQSEFGDISYVSKNIDNFKGDVDEAILNTRGWTLQERALAQRTIHFSKNQVYFECSKGVQCESLISYTNERASLLGDSNFPSSIEARYKGGRVMLVQNLYNQYSKRMFWDPQDRPIAISGLEKRLTSAFISRGGYGIFQIFLERGLLWKKSDETGSLKPINFPPERNVPTWSWMAYDGVISYVEVDFDKVDWTNEYSSPFVSDSAAKGKWHWEADGTNRPPVLGLRKVRQLKGDELPETISLDVPDSSDFRTLRCVVLGKDKPNGNAGPHSTSYQCYVLLVKPSLDVRGVFTRVGAGILRDNQIVWDHYEAGNLL